MTDPDFIRPESLAQALEVMNSLGSKALIVAGSTDVMVDMRVGKLDSGITALVDISRLNELNYIKDDDGIIRIGACTTHSDIVRSTVISEYAPVLSKAAGLIGSVLTRNRGTIGGNIITAAQCADTIPPLLVLDAVVVLRDAESSRKVRVEDLLSSAGKGTQMKSSEIMTEIYFRKPEEGSKFVFDKLIRRRAVAKARVNFCAMAVRDKSGRVSDIRIAPGSVTPYHMRFRDAETILKGRIPDAGLVCEAAEKISDMMAEITGGRWSLPYKKPVLKVMAERGLGSILEVADE